MTVHEYKAVLFGRVRFPARSVQYLGKPRKISKFCPSITRSTCTVKNKKQQTGRKILQILCGYNEKSVRKHSLRQ